eukprot:TRINITY_DN1852_c0_g2_i1.p1 TRINITY_DN1852_c0_g2~~TRINITY_DN1852_c0_g2_i1.p1  ORF type:complete len:105 (+),score=6.96 TRINITY_DN1852_c0_g2_i1:286-600(+)
MSMSSSMISCTLFTKSFSLTFLVDNSGLGSLQNTFHGFLQSSRDFLSLWTLLRGTKVNLDSFGYHALHANQECHHGASPFLLAENNLFQIAVYVRSCDLNQLTL